MAINVNDDVMSLKINGELIATATCVGGGEWVVNAWPKYFDRNQAITALTLAERLAMGYGEEDATRHRLARRSCAVSERSIVQRAQPTALVMEQATQIAKQGVPR